jgi:hypothetical protein
MRRALCPCGILLFGGLFTQDVIHRDLRQKVDEGMQRVRAPVLGLQVTRAVQASFVCAVRICAAQLRRKFLDVSRLDDRRTIL